jgi:hypothetical protein
MVVSEPKLYVVEKEYYTSGTYKTRLWEVLADRVEETENKSLVFYLTEGDGSEYAVCSFAYHSWDRWRLDSEYVADITEKTGSEAASYR